MCILPGTAEREAVKVAQTIVNEVARLNIHHQNSAAAGYVTVSIGVATEVPKKGQGEMSDLIRTADQRLYAAKLQGRNRVVPLFKSV